MSRGIMNICRKVTVWLISGPVEQIHYPMYLEPGADNKAVASFKVIES